MMISGTPADDSAAPGDPRHLADIPRLLFSLDDARAALGIGESLFKQEIAAGRIRTVRVGRRRLVTAGALDDYVRMLEAEAAAGVDASVSDLAAAAARRGRAS